MAGKPHQEEEEHKAEAAGMMRWLLTYADMITLLLACFIVIVGASVTSEAKFRILSAQAERVFGAGQRTVISGANNLLDGQGNRIMPFPSQGTKQPVNPNPPAGLPVTITANGILITGKSDLLFNSGAAEMKPDSKASMGPSTDAYKYLEKVNQGDNCLLIKGHTDDRPISTGAYPSNWELSAARSAAIARYLMYDLKVVSEDRVTIAGNAYTEPVMPNDTDEDRLKNRRVEMWVLNGDACKVLKDLKESSKKAATQFDTGM